MRRSLCLLGWPGWTLVVGILAAVATEATACSGPGAGRAMRVSGQIGLGFAGGSVALVLAGGSVLFRRGQPWRVPLITVMIVLQPVLWIATNRGDCGYALVFWSSVMFLLTAVVVVVAIVWPGRDPAGRGQWRVAGGLAGLLVGLPIVAVDLGSAFTPSVALVGLVVASAVVAGGLGGDWFWQSRTEGRRSWRLDLRTLLLLPVLLAPVLALLLPARPYEAAVSVSQSFRFLAVDAATGQPIPRATVRVVDPRFPEDDRDQQYPAAVTSADGAVESFFTAQIHGRAGLLGRTEVTTYHPLFVRAEAPGYRPFAAALASDPPTARTDLTDPPLGLTFPPPPSATIRLRPSGDGRP